MQQADKIFGTFMTKDRTRSGFIFGMLRRDSDSDDGFSPTENPDEAVCVVGTVTEGPDAGQTVAFKPESLQEGITAGRIVLKRTMQ